jgi:redox-sensing transcriptional repressor
MLAWKEWSDEFMCTSVSRATLGRLPKYLEHLKGTDLKYVSASIIARELGLGEVQVRKDLASVCDKGKPKIGYLKNDLIESIQACIGKESRANAVLIGAGKLGQALLDYKGFEEYGVSIVSAFDTNEHLVSSNEKILPMSELCDVCKKQAVEIGIISVSAESAQKVCDLLISFGIKAIWNFAPCELTVPLGVAFVQENLALSLAHLKNKIRNN